MHVLPVHTASISHSPWQHSGVRMSFWCVSNFLKEHLKQSDSSRSSMCPLDVVGDTAISPCEDSHSLSFAVSLYMLSIEIAAFPQRWMSLGSLSARLQLTSPGFRGDRQSTWQPIYYNCSMTPSDSLCVGNVLQLPPLLCVCVLVCV